MLLDWGPPLGRFRFMVLVPEAILPMFTAGTALHVQCLQGLPPGAELVMKRWDGQSVALVFRHESWPIIAHGQMIPPLDIQLAPAAPPQMMPQEQPPASAPPQTPGGAAPMRVQIVDHLSRQQRRALMRRPQVN